jgi:DNA-binding MarR family transcriptional regulator
MKDAFLYPGPPRTWPEIQVMRRIWRAAARITALHAPHFEALGIPMVEFDLLSTLGNTEGMRMKDLAMTMVTTASNVTRVCAVMEKKGLVQRQRAQSSDREVIAKLTPKGQALFEVLFPKTVNYSAQIIDTALEPGEQKQLAELLDKLVSRVRAPDAEASTARGPSRAPALPKRK